jgi:hypothetical protein
LFENVRTWIADLDYGNVPGWIAAFSLLLAFRIFRLDRRATERTQVDLIGVWFKVDYERTFSPEAARVETGKFIRFVRNASALPVEIVQIAFSIHTT